MEQIADRVLARFSPTALASWFGEALPSLITALLVMLIFLLLWKALSRGLNLMRSRTRLDPTVASFVNTSLKYVLFTVARLMALGELGINTGSKMRRITSPPGSS